MPRLEGCQASEAARLLLQGYVSLNDRQQRWPPHRQIRHRWIRFIRRSCLFEIKPKGYYYVCIYLLTPPITVKNPQRLAACLLERRSTGEQTTPHRPLSNHLEGITAKTQVNAPPCSYPPAKRIDPKNQTSQRMKCCRARLFRPQRNRSFFHLNTAGCPSCAALTFRFVPLEFITVRCASRWLSAFFIFPACGTRDSRVSACPRLAKPTHPLLTRNI